MENGAALKPKVTIFVNRKRGIADDKGHYHSRSGGRERDGRGCVEGRFRLPRVVGAICTSQERRQAISAILEMELRLMIRCSRWSLPGEKRLNTPAQLRRGSANNSCGTRMVSVLSIPGTMPDYLPEKIPD